MPKAALPPKAPKPNHVIHGDPSRHQDVFVWAVGRQDNFLEPKKRTHPHLGGGAINKTYDTYALVALVTGGYDSSSFIE